MKRYLMKYPTFVLLMSCGILRLYAAPSGLALACSEKENRTMFDLSGPWSVRLDPQDVGVENGWFNGLEKGTIIELPGIATEAGLGEPLKLDPASSKEVFLHLHERFSYEGAAWYVKTVEVPQEWAGKNATLLLERTIWETTVWVNGHKVGTQDSLSVPHRHRVGPFLKPGENTIAVRVDNRPEVDIGRSGHAYTYETQSIWNGIVGRVELQVEEPVRIARFHVAPQPKGKQLPLRIFIENHSGKRHSGTLAVRAVPVTHEAPVLPVLRRKVVVGEEGAEVELAYPLEGAVEWSEFAPNLYRLECIFEGRGFATEQSVVTGFRNVEATDKKILINGKSSFMRGSLECCIFPKTGYPAMGAAGWDKIFSTAKAYGLNHLRFHSWCPPEAAFASADRYGIYLQVELPNWTSAMGRRPKVDDFLKKEGERILREYGHHPSFVFFSLGNELAGDYGFMDGMVEHFRSLAPHLLYTSTSYSFSERGALPGPSDDFFISQRTKSGWVRGQGFLNSNFPSTDTDYAEGLTCLSIPLVTHEVGQYHVFPDLRELKKYRDSLLRPTAWEAIRDDLKSKGRLDLAARYTRDSGKLAALLYKEDVERALRTPGLTGIQLLQLQDFPGQGTATVGVLDSFWDDKGVITAGEFSQFCSPTVPLVRMKKMVWQNTETFTALLEAAHFGSAPLKQAKIGWKIICDGQVLAEETLTARDVPIGCAIPLGKVEFPLTQFAEVSRINLVISLDGHENSWPLWIYPAKPAAETKDPGFELHRALTKNTLDALAQGKRVLLAPPAGAIKKSLPSRFIPVFWSPVHFKSQPASCGATILADHPCWQDFPTDTHINWQWWELTAHSTSIDLEGINGIDPRRDIPFAFIDKFNRNALPAAIFEASVGPGKLLVCSLDIHSDLENRVVARQLRRSLENYIASNQFDPKGTISSEQLRSILGEADCIVHASSTHPDYLASKVADGKNDTIWHSDWTKDTGLPITLTLDLLKKKVIAGIDYLPRQDSNRGRIKDYQIQISRDGEKWINLVPRTSFKEGGIKQHIPFKEPVKLRYLRLVILSEEQGNTFASCAEFTPIEADPGDVRDLGIVPGFNDIIK